MEILETLLFPFVTVVFFLICQVVRKFFGRLLIPRLFLQLGTAGHPQAVSVLAPRAILNWLRSDFQLPRDIPWVVVLSLQTTLLSMVPFAGYPVLKFENAPATMTLVFMTTALAALWVCQKNSEKTSRRFTIRQVFRSSIGSVVLLLMMQSVFFSLGIQSFEELTAEIWIVAKSPLSFALLILGLMLSPAFRIEIPEPGVGNGAAKLIRHASECFWVALLITLFLSGGIKPAPVAVLVVAIKSGICLFLMDVFEEFLPRARAFAVERGTLFLVFPLLLLLMLALVWRRLLG